MTTNTSNHIPQGTFGNRVCRILGKGVVQRNAPLATADELGNGMLVTHARRAMVAAPIVALVTAWLARGASNTIGAIGHGLRFVADPVTGNGSPLFVEAKGAPTGTVYLFKASAKREALLAAFEAAGVPVVGADVEGGTKDGLRVTFGSEGFDGQVALSVIMGEHDAAKGLSCYMTTGLTGWDGGTMATAMREANIALGDAPYTLPVASEPVANEAKPEGSKGKRGRPKGVTKAKGTKAAEDSIPQADSVTDAVA